jgi:putative endonuclease
MSLKKSINPLGPEGEDIAVRYLQGKGLTIVQRNYKTPMGEADIIAEDQGTIVFIEVKTRSNEKFGEPFEAVNTRKRGKLKKIALYYQKKLGSERRIRFDVISIKRKDEGHLIEHIMEAFW